MISIIVPVYNVEKYLDECIQSIHEQTYTDWECILINDGSKDNSASICDQWAQKDKRIQAIHQINQGVSAARNKGIQIAKGEFIAFIDSDDWIDKEYLYCMYEAYKKHPSSDLIVSGLIHHYNDGKAINKTPEKSQTFELTKNNIKSFVDLNTKYLLYPPYIKLYKSSIIKDNFIFFDRNYSYGEDLLFNYQYLEHVNTITCIDKAYYHYRIIGSGTLSSKLRYDQFKTDYTQWNILCSLYKRKNLWHDEAKEYLYHRLWGIIYDGIFLYPKLKGVGKEYIKSILSIPEIKELKQYQHIYPCKKWIKMAILNRQTFIFYLFFKFNKK